MLISLALITAIIAESLIVLQSTFMRIFINSYNTTTSEKLVVIPLMMIFALLLSSLFSYLFSALSRLSENEIYNNIKNKIDSCFPKDRLEIPHLICRNESLKFLYLPATILKLILICVFLLLESPIFLIGSIILTLPATMIALVWANQQSKLDKQILASQILPSHSIDSSYLLLLLKKWQLNEKVSSLFYIAPHAFTVIVMFWYLSTHAKTVGALVSAIILFSFLIKNCLTLVDLYKEYVLTNLMSENRILEIRKIGKIEDLMSSIPVGLIAITDSDLFVSNISFSEKTRIVNEDYFISNYNQLLKKSKDFSIGLITNNSDLLKKCHFIIDKSKTSILEASHAS